MLEDIDKKQKRTLSGEQTANLMSKDSILEKTTYTKEKKTDFNESGLFKSLGVEEEKVKEVNVKEETTGFDTDFWNNLMK